MANNPNIQMTIEYKPTAIMQMQLEGEFLKMAKLVPFWRKRKADEIKDRYMQIERKGFHFTANDRGEESNINQ